MKKRDVLLIIVVVINLFLLLNISDVNEEISRIKRVNSNMEDQISDLAQQGDRLYDYMRDGDKRDSIYEEYAVETRGKVDLDTLSIPAILKVLPNEIKDSDIYMVEEEGTLKKLMRQGDIFIHKFDYNIMLGQEYTLVRDRSGFITKEKLDDLELECEILNPRVRLGGYGYAGGRSDSKINGHLEFDFNYKKNIDGLIESVDSIAYINDKEVSLYFKTEIEEDELTLDCHGINIEDIRVDNILRVDVEMKDINGFVYKYNLNHINIKADAEGDIDMRLQGEESRDKISPCLESISYKNKIIYKKK